MFFQFNFFGLVLILVSIISLYSFYYSYKHREDKLYYYFAFFSLFCFLDFILQGCDVLTTPFMVKSFFGQICAVGYIFIVPYWFLLVYYFIYQKDASWKLKVLIFIIPIISIVAALTNPWTHWFFSSVSLPPANIPYKLQLYYTANWAYTLLCVYNIVMLIIMTGMLIYGLSKSKKINHNNYILIIIANVTSLIITLLAYTTIYTGFSWGLIAYMVGFLFVSLVVYLYDAFDVMSLVNENIIEDINVGIIYFNPKDILKSVNFSGTLLNVTREDINNNVDEIFKDNPEFLSFYNDDNLDNTEIYYNEKWIEVKKKIMIENTDNLGKIFTLTDVSNKVYELNHRVKNNLQIILSLLNLDMRFHPEDPEIVLEGTRSRLNYMFTLHDKIYRSSSNTDGDIKDYLPDIAKSLLQMYESNIKVWEDMDNAIIGLDLTIPLGLILTEMINNTIKYAFPDTDKGNFYIKFKKEGNNGILDLYDDGKGFPEGFDFESSTGLGMTVIKSLTSQIDGEATIIPDQGAHLKIVFPIN